MLTILVEDVEADSGGVEVVRVTAVVASLVPRHAGDAEGGAGGGGGVLHLDHAAPRHQLTIVFPDHEPGTDNGGCDDTLQLQWTVLSHVDIRSPEYPHLLIAMLIINY